MSLIRYRQPIVTRLFPHAGNRQFMVPNVPPLGPELIPDPYFTTWTDPAFPDGWDLINADANNFVEEGAGGGLRVISDGTVGVGIQRLSVTETDTPYCLCWRYSDLTDGAVVVGGAFTGTLQSAVDVLTCVKPTTSVNTFLSVTRADSAPSLTDCTLDYLSVRKVQSK